MALDLGKEIRCPTLKINTNKTKVYSLTGPICFKGHNAEVIEQFTYPGSVFSADGIAGLCIL